MLSKYPFLVLAALCPVLPAAVIGTSTAAPPLTLARIETLPPAQRPAWRKYLERSNEQMKADRAALAAELKQAGMADALVPPSGGAARSIPLDRAPEWYAGAEARRIADIVVSFQTPAGGWSKNLNLADHVRRPGEHFAPNNLSRFAGNGDFDNPADIHWEYVGTLDNDATITEMRFLAKVANGAEQAGAAYRASFLRGLQYLFDAQYPNGGWPQVWPLQGGYHDAITLNDGAFAHALELLQDVAGARTPFAFVSAPLRKRARQSMENGIACVLAAQIVIHGRRTVWGQQHDMLTLEPVAARNYEPAAQSSSESAGMLLFLMSLPRSRSLIAAIDAGAAWLRKTAIGGKAYVRGPEGRNLVSKPDAAPIWSRFYAVGSDEPVFGDRDKTIHDTVAEISRERRDGYSWYTGEPQEALKRYAQWKAER